MILEYQPNTLSYILRVRRGEADPRMIMKEHGLNFSTTASSRSGDAVLFTHSPYAAAVFADVASPLAKSKLSGILREIEASSATESKAHIRIPADQELSPFQVADCEYALRRHNSLIGDQPGLGKTPVAISIANEIRARRVLVICPANIRNQWAREIRKWSTMPWPYVVYPILNSSRGVHPTAGWNIVSYDLARTKAIGAALAKGTYDLIILDEAHYLKEMDSQRTRAVFGDHTGYMRKAVHDETGAIVDHEIWFQALAAKAGMVVALTGTPLPNRPRECYTLIRGLLWESIDFMSEAKFKAKFNPSAMLEGTRKDGTTYMYKREEAGRHGELQNILRANIMVRHLKRDVLKQLKLPVYNVIQVDENEDIKKVLEAEKMLDIDPDHPELFEHAHDEVLGQIAVVRHMMGRAIAPLAADYIEMLLDGGEEKIVVFGHHIDVLDILQRRLFKHGVIRIDGSVVANKKQRLVDDYVDDLTKRVMLGNMISLGTGTDKLQHVASRAVFVEYDWVPGNNQQAVDRLDRRGQLKTVLADFMVAQGSIAERIFSSALRKLNETDKVLDRKSTFA